MKKSTRNEQLSKRSNRNFAAQNTLLRILSKGNFFRTFPQADLEWCFKLPVAYWILQDLVNQMKTKGRCCFSQ